MATDRRSFLALLGFGAAAAVVAPRLNTPPQSAPPAEPAPVTSAYLDGVPWAYTMCETSANSPICVGDFADWVTIDRRVVNVR